MKLSFCNICVRGDSKNRLNSILSCGEKYSYCILYYLALKRFLTINSDCIFTMNSLLNFINQSYITIDKNINRQNKYLKEFLVRIIYLKIFNLVKLSNLKFYEINDIDSLESKINNISSNELICLSYNKNIEKKFGFTFIDENDIYKIKNYIGNDSLSKIKLLNIFFDISSRIFTPRCDDERDKKEQYKYCYPTYDNFINDGVASKKDTIENYLNILVSLGLIRYDGIGNLVKDNECRTGAYHYILVKDYPDYKVNDFEMLFKKILSAYQREKETNGWQVIGKKKMRKDELITFVDQLTPTQKEMDAVVSQSDNNSDNIVTFSLPKKISEEEIDQHDSKSLEKYLGDLGFIYERYLTDIEYKAYTIEHFFEELCDDPRFSYDGYLKSIGVVRNNDQEDIQDYQY